MATLARYQAEKRSKNKEMEEAITKLSENLGRLNWQSFFTNSNLGALPSIENIKETKEAITKRKPYWIDNLSGQTATATSASYSAEKIKETEEVITKFQDDISTKRTVIDNLSSQMATLARYQAEKRSKNKETEEAITKLSENLARLNWKPL